MTKLEALTELEKIGMAARGDTAEPTLAEKHGPALVLPLMKFKRILSAPPTKRGAFAAHRQQRREKRDRRHG